MATRTALLLLVIATSGRSLRADLFTFRDESGQSVELEAQLVGTGEGVLILEEADGQYRLVPQEAIQRREARDGPAPLPSGKVASRLRERFGAERFRSLVRDPFVIGLVLGTPLEKTSDGKAKGFLTKVGGFLKNVDTAFGAFVKEVKLSAEPAPHPLVVLVFETDEDFERYAGSITGGRGLSTGSLAGFYSGVTNHLAIRLAECRSFDVPLHEAIHQQVYNRNVLKRLAPIPRWFDEGLATGFEGNQGKVSIGPTKISSRYARALLEAKRLTFEKLVTDDAGFTGDVLAGEAYGGAWGLHWLLVTRYRAAYSSYVRRLASKEPLAEDDEAQRLADFQEAFGKDFAEIDKEFRPYLDAGIKKQKVVLHEEHPPGYSLTQQSLGEVELTAIHRADERGGRLEVQGQLTNVSPFRAMAFYVTVVTDAGVYADWHVPALDMQKSAPLPLRHAAKSVRGAPGGPSRSFRVQIRSTPSDSEEAVRWSQGDLPAPGIPD